MCGEEREKIQELSKVSLKLLSLCEKRDFQIIHLFFDCNLLCISVLRVIRRKITQNSVLGWFLIAKLLIISSYQKVIRKLSGIAKIK